MVFPTSVKLPPFSAPVYLVILLKKSMVLMNPIFRVSRVPVRSVAKTTAFLLFFILSFSGASHAQQRVILNQNFIELKDSSGTLLDPFNAQHPNMFCTPGFATTTPQTGTGNCLRYVNDSRCEAPAGSPADTDICIVGWETASPEVYNSIVSSGYIAHPIQIGISNSGLLQNVSTPNGSVELNAEVPNKIFQNVCLASNENIQFSFDLADPNSTGAAASQARIAIWPENSGYPSAASDSFTSASVNVPVFQTFTDSLSAPAAAGIYQIGFEAVLPAAGVAGNYIQNVIITLPPLVDIGGAGTLTGSPTYNKPATGATQVSMLSFRVNGTVGAGVQIPINLAIGSTATADIDFSLDSPTGPIGTPTLTHTNGTGVWVLNIPPGKYSGGLSQANIEVPISILAGGTQGSPETLSFDLGAAVGGAIVADPLCASDFVDTSGTMTILDHGVFPIPTLSEWMLMLLSLILLLLVVRETTVRSKNAETH